MRRHRLLASAIAVAIAMVLLWLVLALLRPLPPHTVVMATGPASGAYAAVGLRYRDILAHEGIDLRLLPTAGALENLAKLQDPRSRVSVGFLQAGTTSAEASPDLVSLGTISYEALWFFCRKILQNQGLGRFAGQTFVDRSGGEWNPGIGAQAVGPQRHQRACGRTASLYARGSGEEAGSRRD